MTNLWNNSIDIVDQNSRYMDIISSTPEGREIFKQWSLWIKINLEKILSNYNIPNGNIVQAGTWNGDLYFELQRIFGKKRCIGFDIEKYIDDPSIVYGDFRKIYHTHSYPCALFYNGLGAWHHNKGSKQAGLDYAIKNLVKNGLYLDVIHENENILKNIPDLEYCYTYDKMLIILRKT